MKRTFSILLAAMLIASLLSSCGEGGSVIYEAGMFSDVQSSAPYAEAVEFCVNEGYLDYIGETFGVNDTVSLSECATIAVKLSGANTSDDIKYVVDNAISQHDYPDWDAPATRAQLAYIVSRSVYLKEINTIIQGAISDVCAHEAGREIYHLYRAGIFTPDGSNTLFRPDDLITRAETAVVILRAKNEDKRVQSDVTRLEASLIAFGDTIGHMPVVNSGKTSDGYNFDALFENVKSYIDAADIACVNQETIFTDGSYTGYPSFGSPKEIGVAEAAAGFDVVTHATNHAFDRGETALLYTAAFWQDYNVKMLGIHESEEDAEKIEVIERNGIKLALLNYTYSLNGYSLPSGKDYLVDLLDKDKVSDDVKRAKAQSDGVIVFFHFGVEYRNSPTDEQREWAQLLADEGVLAVIGTHPHVVEPMEIVTGKNGNAMPIYYSLGNFISSQNDLQCALCAMADFTIVKDSNGTHVENAQILPVITHQQSGYYSAYLLQDYPADMEQRHRFKSTYPTTFSKEYLLELFNSIVNQ